MDLVLAMDLKEGMVVHGKKGDRALYRPLTWGISPTADPVGYLEAMQPRFLYIADLDRIGGTGSHDATIARCAGMVQCCYVDRGCRSPDDLLDGDRIVNVIGTETAGDLFQYHSGMLSLDIRDGLVIPANRRPEEVLAEAERLPFDSFLVLHISAVGTEGGLETAYLERLRHACKKPLFYGGGVRDTGDLSLLAGAGFDGAVIATAVHKNAIPHDMIREGSWCS